MSFVVTAPESVTAAAANLAGIGSALGEATAAAAGPTTGVVAAAADEVSIAISRLFGTYGQEFHAVTAQAAAFHDEFVSLLNGGAAAYLGTEIANAEQGLLNAVNAPARAVLGQLSSGVAAAAEPIGAASLLSNRIDAGVQAVYAAIAGAPAAAVPAGAYQQLFANTTANLQALYGAWAADPLPFLSQLIANQQGYWQQIATALASAIQNFPANLANLPAAIQAGIQELLAFNAAYYVQQFIATQIGFAQEFFTYLHAATTGIVAGLPAFGAQLQVAWQAVLAGNYYDAVQDVAQGVANLLVTGVDSGNPLIGVVFPPIPPNVTATVNPTLLGPLGNLFALGNIPGQEAQYLTNLMPPSILRQMSQNLTNVLNVLTIPSISATTTLPLSQPTAGSASAFFGLPLVLTYAAVGAPFAGLEGLATSATAVQQALLAGNPVGALGALVDAPAVMTNGFLNGETIVDMTIPVPVSYQLPIGPPVSFTAQIVVHLPFDGLLVPPHHITGTISLSSPFSTAPYPVTIFGTPFMGLVPALVNYAPQQLAAAIAPAG